MILFNLNYRVQTMHINCKYYNKILINHGNKLLTNGNK